MASQILASSTRRLAFPGSAPNVDTPFSVNAGTSATDAREEAVMLLSSVRETLLAVVDESACGDVIQGCIFMLQAAAAMVESLVPVESDKGATNG